MSERLSALRPAAERITSIETTMTTNGDGHDNMLVDSGKKMITDGSEETVEIPGWRRLGEADGWKPVPIGVFYPPSNT